MKCSGCFCCQVKREFFFCNFHNLEVFNPENAGCDKGKKSSLTVILSSMDKKSDNKKAESENIAV